MPKAQPSNAEDWATVALPNKYIKVWIFWAEISFFGQVY
jgi:hypothetical protein